jgi:hypothetical protein
MISFLSGIRTRDMYNIPTNPFFRSMGRDEATLHVQRTRQPVLRPSSIAGHFALTYYVIGNGVRHSLLRMNPNYTVDCMSETGYIYGSYINVCALLDSVMGMTPSEPYVIPTSAAATAHS